MSLAEHFLKQIAVPHLVNCLTGEARDLRRLLVLEKIPFPSPVFKAFLRRLSKDLQDRTGIANVLLQLGKSANPLARRRLIENLILNWKVKGARTRTRLRRLGYWVPHFIVLSPTMRCNLNCTGCYSGLYSKEGELSESEMDRILEECRKIGIHLVVLTGGEPYLLKEPLLRLFEKHSDIFFLTFTNGTHFDERLADELARLGNVTPGFSVEGYEEDTDKRRRPGVFQGVLNGMSLLRDRKVPFGISVTYTRENVETVTDRRFVEFFLDKGVVFAWYFMFVPVGKDPDLEMVPSPLQRIKCGEEVAKLRREYPIFMADFWNDGPVVGGCLAGGRRYLHILNSGRVEICVFAHFGIDNIREKSLLDAANSPFFRALRAEFPYNDLGNLKRPCLLMDNPRVLRKLVDRFMVPEGHRHSEDILKDPSVLKWIDDYSKEFAELTDPVWTRQIEDPTSRWFREGYEYKKLFWFRDGIDLERQTSPRDRSQKNLGKG